MATKSFLKNIVIKDKKSAKSFIEALENAEKKGSKLVKINTGVRNIEDKETIWNMFISK